MAMRRINKAGAPAAFKALSDEDLIVAVGKGSRDAFAELVERYKNKVITYAYRHTNDYKTAEDLAQEVFLRIFKKAREYIRTARFSTWLFTITINLVKDEYKRRSRHPSQSLDQKREESRLASELLPDDRAVQPDWVLSQKELADNINRVLGALSGDDRTMIILRDIHGLSYEEIAHVMQVPVGTVKSRLSRARWSFREMWKETE